MVGFDPRDHYTEPTKDEMLQGGSLTKRVVQPSMSHLLEKRKPEVDRDLNLEREREDDRRDEDSDEAKESALDASEAKGVGTSSGGNAAANEGGQTASTAAPQKNDPDDGEHTDSTESQIEARKAKESGNDANDGSEGAKTEPVVETVPSDTAEASSESDSGDVLENSPADTKTKPSRVVDRSDTRPIKERLAEIEGSNPVVHEKLKMVLGDGQITRTSTPDILIDHLRLTIAGTTGGEFAEMLNASSLVTAFLLARTGVDIEVDSNTALVVKLFREADPRLLAVENKINELLTQIDKVDGVTSRTHNRMIDVERVVDGVELGVSYLITDRTVGLATPNVAAENIETAQRDVLTVRERLKQQSKAQRKIERDKLGRDNQ